MTGPDASVRIDRLRRTVADLARSIDFYRGALGFELARGDARSARLRLGEQHIELLQHADPMPLPPGAIAPDPRFQHAAIVTCDMESAWRRVEAHGAVAISRHGPQVLPANTGGVTAFKFRDLDGHPLELIRFPAGVGDPRWQGVAANGSTLGIDHFALVVAAVDRSTAFMAQRLGFRVSDRGVNCGLEQDRLDGLEGVEVDVVSLVPLAGAGKPHLELLGYRHPTPAGPPDLVPSALDRAGRDVVVCIGTEATDTGAGPRWLDDPDGHAFLLKR